MNKFRISSTNSNSYQRSVVRVYNNKNQLIAEQFINKRDPYGYIKTLNKSKHLDELYNKLVVKNHMTVLEFNNLFNSKF